MDQQIECKITILMDENGTWRVGYLDDLSDAASGLSDEGGTMVRQVNITVTMSPPVATELSVTVPDEAGRVAAAEVEG